MRRFFAHFVFAKSININKSKHMSSVFRLRPSNEFTIDEFINEYLWFSRPTEYNDTEDANIIAFSDVNENVKKTFNRVFSNYTEFGEQISLSGICCFTRSLPQLSNWKYFPKGANGVFFEYNKEKIEQYFIKHYAYGDCFKEVEYLTNQMRILSSTDEGYDVLWQSDKNGSLYKSLRGDIEHDAKTMDKFIFKLLTRINIKYQRQNELRIILGGRNIPDKSPDLKGYKVRIPLDSIVNIYIQPNTPKIFLNKLKEVIPKTISIEIIT